MKTSPGRRVSNWWILVGALVAAGVGVLLCLYPPSQLFASDQHECENPMQRMNEETRLRGRAEYKRRTGQDLPETVPEYSARP